ncbi:MAG: hydroxylase [Proteobacteria bacterium]|nr:hydroxylase [Pseudomonadota bacterium]MBK8959731.1 hydroxylase [Pseudomonadota bacterium]
MSVTQQQLLERVGDALPGIAARAASTEAQRRPHDDSIAALIDCGIMQTLVPKRFGGHELGLDALSRIARAVSSACLSTGWVTAFYLGHNWMLTKFPLEVQREVWAERPFGLIPIQPSPGVSITPVSGGYEISGRQSFSSGIMHADWVMIAKAGGDDARAFVVPRQDVEVVDVWHMSGMAGTGSNDVIIDKVFVPAHRTLPMDQLFNGTDSIHDNPLYAVPLLPFIYCEVMGVYCGGLDGATAAYQSHVENKVVTWGGDALAHKQAVHIQLGEAHARTTAAGTLLEGLVAMTEACMRQRQFTLDTRLELKLRAGYIADLCREGVNTLMSRAGSKSFSTAAPLQRFFRDLNMLATHAFIERDVAFELYGRHRLGMAPNSPLV